MVEVAGWGASSCEVESQGARPVDEGPLRESPAIFQRYRIVDTEDKAAALRTLEAFA